ncbi:MAG: porin family protein [bacterium]|nr:porin family protein [bacterium]
MNGQQNHDQIFSLKPSFGGNGCQIHGDAYDGYDKFGVFFGLGLNARLNSKASIELGFYLSQKGALHNPNQNAGDYSSYRLTLNYIDLPLSFRYLFLPKYFFTIGPSVAYLAKYKEVINYTDETGNYPFNKFEVGVNIGLGRKLGDKFSVELRCSNSILPIRGYGVNSTVFYPNPVAQFFNKGLYSNILTLFFAYHIDLNKKA